MDETRIFELSLGNVNGLDKLPLVSLIVPVYNDEDTLKESLQSLVNQEYPNKEIIAIDDGSTDQTAKILADMASKSQSIKVFRVDHSGVTKARNFGLKNSKGEIIFYAEGDAIYNQDYVSKAVTELAKNQGMGGVCLTGGLWITRETIVSKFIDVENRIKRKMLEAGKMEPYYAWIFRRQALEEVDGFDERLFQAEDKDIFTRVKRAGYSIGLVTGINWRHKRDQDLWSYMKRAYIGGKSRILYLMKHRKISEFLRNLVFPWFVFACLVIAPLTLLALYPPLFFLAAYFFIKLGLLLHQGWNHVPRRRYLLLLPFFSLLRYIAISLGSTYGLGIVLERKLRRLPTDWSSVN